MDKISSYIAKKPDEHGHIHYSDEENSVWHDLITRQMKTIENRACQEFIDGVDLLNFSYDCIPQLDDVSKALDKATGWFVERVPALINFDRFFGLLAHRKFPAATFIRRREKLDYLQEPDIFHEIFGHCPMLTNQVYADFTQKYGELGLKANEKDRVMLARLYWFTVEFGLINTKDGVRSYGGGILSSHEETIYSVDSDIPAHKPFDALETFRTPYRIDILQTIYFVLEHYEDLYKIMENDLIRLINNARELGEYPPTFSPKLENNHWC